jgi:hypothetical protein
MNCEMIKGCPRTWCGSVFTNRFESSLQGRTSSSALGIPRTAGSNQFAAEPKEYGAIPRPYQP